MQYFKTMRVIDFDPLSHIRTINKSSVITKTRLDKVDSLVQIVILIHFAEL